MKDIDAPSLADPGMFPILSERESAALAAHGDRIEAAAGEVLVEPGDAQSPMFLVLAGRIEIVRPGATTEEAVGVLGPGQFTGEANMLSNRPGLVRLRAVEPSVLVRVDRPRLGKLIQTEGALGEILLRAFIHRRAALIAQRVSNVILLGSDHCAGTLRTKEFLTRNGCPYTYFDLDRTGDVQELLDRFRVDAADIPVLLCGPRVLRNPSLLEIAECLGLNDRLDQAQVHDVVVVGAGPSGLAAAVYAASEGLDTVVLEAGSPGGQAGSSSRIENYLGFPAGISGLDLTAAAYTQAQKFGAHVLVAEGARRLACDRRPYVVEMADGRTVAARAVIVSTGAAYRKPGIENLARFEGAGVYYGATFMEAQLCDGQEVIVVGGGNSAGQAAVFLAETAARVTILVRADGLAETMSRYLVLRIEGHPSIVVKTRTEIEALEGDAHLERVRWRNDSTSGTEPVRHVFVMAGADPNSGWLGGCLALDTKGFIKTGGDLEAEDLEHARWPRARAPHLLETSLPGVFAVGDVRSGSVKRVAPSVGEGAIAVSLVHQVLRE